MPALLMLFMMTGAAQRPAVSAVSVTAKVQKLYDGTQDFTAEFSQTYERVDLGRKQASRGRVVFRKPGQIRFDYLEPQEKTFAVDGSTLWIYQVADGQALVDRCFKADGLTASLVFLGGGGRIADQFTVTLLQPTQADHVLQLVPKQAQGAFKSVTLHVDKRTFEVHESVVQDPSGNPNRFVFSNVKRNGGLKADQVVFAPPAGVSVNPVPGSCAATGP